MKTKYQIQAEQFIREWKQLRIKYPDQESFSAKAEMLLLSLSEEDLSVLESILDMTLAYPLDENC